MDKFEKWWLEETRKIIHGDGPIKLPDQRESFRAGMRAAAAMANEHMSRHVTSGVLELRDDILAEADK